MLSFNDIFKKSFLEGFEASDIRAVTLIAALLFTALISVYIFFIYRIVTRKTFYSKTFALSLIGVSLITTSIIFTIQSSLVVSLGMVGALSIIRFRTAIKDPLDLMFLFWSISTGIICGAGLGKFAVILALFMAAAIIIIEKLPVGKCPMILIVNANRDDIEAELIDVIKKYAKYHTIKSRNVTMNEVDYTIEIRSKEEKKLVDNVVKISGIQSVSLLSHDGEVSF